MSAEQNNDNPRKGGRPTKAEGPRVDYNLLDSLLVYGRLEAPADGGVPTPVYLSHRELAAEFGVACSVISEYAKRHDCARRRERAEARLLAKTEEKFLEMRAEAIALSKEDSLAIIDSWLVGFRSAITEGRTRFDSAADFNTMMRLKEFIQGGADSRQEIHAALSLTDLQSRHRTMLQDAEETTDAERGVVQRPLLPGGAAKPDTGSPAASACDADMQTEHFEETPRESNAAYDHGEGAGTLIESRDYESRGDCEQSQGVTVNEEEQ